MKILSNPRGVFLFVWLAIVLAMYEARGAMPTLDNFNREHFNITTGGAPSNVVKVLNPSTWTNSAGTIEPVDLSLPVFITNHLVLGPGTLYNYGFSSGANYSRVSLSHTGTNGSVVINSEGAGTAGPGRGYLFQVDGVSQDAMAANSGYTGTGNKYKADDGTYKATGSSIAAVPGTYSIGTNLVFMGVATNLSAGTVDVYTVPAGYNALLGCLEVTQGTNASTVATVAQIKTGGSYYTIKTGGNASTSINAVGTAISPPAYSLLGPSESWSLTNAAAGMSVWYSGFLVPTNSTLRLVRVTSFSAGNNTVYTVPTGKYALVLGATGTSGTSIFTGAGHAVYANGSGASRTTSIYVALNGSTLDSTTLVLPSAAAATGAFRNINFFPQMLPSGAIVVVNTDSNAAGQGFFMCVFEYGS